MAPLTGTLVALIVAFGLLTAPIPGEAQPPGKVWRIGVLASALDTADGPLFEAFLDGLRKLGYVQDRNMDIEWRSSEGNVDQLAALAASLVRSKVDVILATSLQPALAAAEATKTIPIVFVVAADPVRHGLVSDPARPGGNITGLATYMPAESGQKALQFLREAAPKVSRVAVLTNPANPAHTDLMAQALPSAAQRLSLTLLPFEVKAPDDVQSAFDTAVRDRADAVYVLRDVLTFMYRARIVGLAVKTRLPTMYASRGAVEAGGLMSYGPRLRDLFRRAATYVDQIIKGTKPGSLPVEQTPQFELVINVATAKSLGLTLSPSLLQKADEVIQ
jgi:putative tryptophan/tyrosine transport system substrate-binding protein